jgi:hypothetical protein
MKTFLLISGAVLTAACAARETLPITTTSASIDKVPSEHAIRELTSERCHRQLSCDNIGAGKKWDTLDACMTATRKVTRDQLVNTSCPAFDSGELSMCLDDTRDQRCEDVGDSTPDSCASVRLCR